MIKKITQKKAKGHVLYSHSNMEKDAQPQSNTSELETHHSELLSPMIEILSNIIHETVRQWL
jgi:hypothetical protein